MKICAVVPAYKVTDHIVEVVHGLQNHVDHIFVIDDACPNNSGDHLLEALDLQDAISIIKLPENQGVGGAVIAGYRAALTQGFDIAIKVDGDGQMDPKHIPNLIAPIIAGEADYTKGNRFFDPSYLDKMPIGRLIGNAGLSFISKVSTGQWQIMDPTNGFTAIHTKILPWLHLDKLEKRYFFETDMLFRLGTIDALVQDIPMPAVYLSEQSNLDVKSAFFEFGFKHVFLLFKRLFYTYFLRNFSLASVFLITSIPLILFGGAFGVFQWFHSISTGNPATPGTIMLAAFPLLVGLQFLLSFLSLDMSKRIQRPLWIRLGGLKPHTG